MASNPDFKDLLQLLSEEKVDYLIVGAHAVVYFAEPRYTKDLDVFVRPTPDNAERVWRALVRFCAPLKDVTVDDFCRPGVVYQMGVPPNRIDVIMSISGVPFDEAWSQHVTSTYDGVPIHIIGLKALIKNKLASGRDQDLLDVKRLKQINPENRD